jgi:hypothetical protein
MPLNIIIINIYFVSLNFIIQFSYAKFNFRYNMTLILLIFKIFTEMSKKNFILRYNISHH